MPAKNLYREDGVGIYCHIHNKGVEKRIIFNNEEDYEVFQGFLKDYLTPSKDPASLKKSFKINGKAFQGTPHQPKNYFNKVELIAYSLRPDHFHLVLHQLATGSLESFIRSLCTRYSMYYNKKYNHTGALFEGPYKSVQLKTEQLPDLTSYLHHSPTHSSYSEYLGLRETSWVKPQIVLSSFKNKTDYYKKFVEKYDPSQKDNELSEDFTIENKSHYLERRDLESNEEAQLETNSKPRLGLPQFLTLSITIFALLVTLGIRNIIASSGSNSYGPPIQISYRSLMAIDYRHSPSTAPSVLSEETSRTTPNNLASVSPKPTETEKATSEAQLKSIVTVKIDDTSSYVNIRQEATVSAKIIGQAKNGDVFELITKEESDWYKVRLGSMSAGFISAEYSELEN
ncbi:SH3 domain-containing protein [Candidatus Roizmanbacteria bacterium]|nr:SH3 domain-containing protein [Candidatus Roizmanbacteria bacterium]